MKNLENFVFGAVMLRPTGPNDLDFVLAAEQHRDNSLFIRQWSAERHLQALADPDIGHFIITCASTGKRLGHVILVGLNDTDRSVELRRVVITEKGKGYGRQTIRMVKSFVFEKLVSHRLWLDVMLYNKRAFKLYKSEGFLVEGVHREAVRQGNRFVDVRVMSVLRDEYYRRFEKRPTRLLTDSLSIEESSGITVGY